MSIYINDDLKARMDKFPSKNWSGVAQDAFSLEIESTGSDDMSMEQTIERLRASKQKAESTQRPEWTAAGRDWAMISSEYDDLKRMAEIDPDDSHTAKELLKLIYEAIYLEKPSDMELRDYVERHLQDHGNPSMSQLRWYLEGVKQVWAEVEDKI